MAIWQYQFLLIPQRDLFELGAVYHLPEEDLESFPFWKKDDYPIGFFEPLTNLLESKESGNKNMVQFGSSEETCVEISMKNDGISEVSVRIDYRQDYSEFLKTLLAFCHQHSLALLDEENYIRQLDAGVISSVMLESPQAKELAAMQNQA